MKPKKTLQSLLLSTILLILTQESSQELTKRDLQASLGPGCTRGTVDNCRDCMDEYYLSSGQCIPCDSNCKRCDINGCEQCGPGHFGDREAIPTPGYVLCVPCVDSCEICRNANHCTICLDTHRSANGGKECKKIGLERFFFPVFLISCLLVCCGCVFICILCGIRKVKVGARRRREKEEFVYMNPVVASGTSSRFTSGTYRSFNGSFGTQRMVGQNFGVGNPQPVRAAENHFQPNFAKNDAQQAHPHNNFNQGSRPRQLD